MYTNCEHRYKRYICGSRTPAQDNITNECAFTALALVKKYSTYNYQEYGVRPNAQCVYRVTGGYIIFGE